MGKFSGVLIASDYDNTMAFTEGALRQQKEMPSLSAENRQAIEYFMAEGGIFSVATGRALPSFSRVCGDLPMNGPAVLFNGAAIYDFASKKYLHTAFLDPSVLPYVAEVLAAWPDAAAEIYHDDDAIHALQPNALTAVHLHLTHTPTEVLSSVEDVPLPVSKVLFEIESEKVNALCDYINAQPWAQEYERVLPSSAFFIELTARGANKGDMVDKLRRMLHIERQHLFCVGDHANDVGMLRRAAIPFAPENAIDEVKAVEGVHILPHADHHAIAAMIEELDKRY
ncbi:MAG: HAD-IIB family hydrolase [Oscillospiraceae bacterium]|nr:HAD-IIB family hydrolase [Oscillospiraceae bacterium]